MLKVNFAEVETGKDRVMSELEKTPIGQVNLGIQVKKTGGRPQNGRVPFPAAAALSLHTLPCTADTLERTGIPWVD